MCQILMQASLQASCKSLMYGYLCTEDEVYDLIAELDDSKSSDPDGISVKILKATITPSLTSYSIQPILKEGHLAKQSCNSGTVTGIFVQWGSSHAQ